MDREGFRSRLKQYKEAKGFDPLLKYWEWKLTYDSAPQPDSLPSLPQPDSPTSSSQELESRAHRLDSGYYNVNREPYDSPYDDARYYDYRKPRFELRKGNIHYSNPDLLNGLGRFGKVIRGGSMIGETIQLLFPSEEAEVIESLRSNMDKQNKWLTGLESIPKYDEGTGSVETNSEIPWWQRIINFGEKVQPFTQTDIEQRENNELRKRLARSKYIMGVLSDVGASGKNLIEALYDPTTGGDQLDVFLLNIEDLQQIMEQRGWKKVDIKNERDPYGIVRTGANYHLTKHNEVPVYENTFDSDTTVTRDQLTKLFNVSNEIIPGTGSFGNAGSYSNAIYIHKDTGKIYSRSYDLNDYGPTQQSNGFISTVGGFKRKVAEKLDEIGTPFVIRTGFVPLNDYDVRHIANQNPKYKELIDNAKISIKTSKIQRKAEGGEVEPDPLEVLERSRPRVAGIPINDKPLETYGPFEELGTAAFLGGLGGSLVRGAFKNYGKALSAIAFGDYGNENALVLKKPLRKGDPTVKPISTENISEDTRDFFREYVMPLSDHLTEQEKLDFINNNRNFMYNVYPESRFDEGVLGFRNKYTGEIALNEKILDDPITFGRTMAHEGGHAFNQFKERPKSQTYRINRNSPRTKEQKKARTGSNSEAAATHEANKWDIINDFELKNGRKPTLEEFQQHVDSVMSKELSDFRKLDSYGRMYEENEIKKLALKHLTAYDYSKWLDTYKRNTLKYIPASVPFIVTTNTEES